MSDNSDRCNHWLIGAKVGIPALRDLQCSREKNHAHEPGNHYHFNGSENWNDAAGEYRNG